MDTPTAPRWMSSTEVARLLGVHRDTIKRWPIPYLQAGRLGHRRYREADVVAFLDAARRNDEGERAADPR